MWRKFPSLFYPAFALHEILSKYSGAAEHLLATLPETKAGEIARLRMNKLPKWGMKHPKLFGVDSAVAAAAAAADAAAAASDDKKKKGASKKEASRSARDGGGGGKKAKGGGGRGGSGAGAGADRFSKLDLFEAGLTGGKGPHRAPRCPRTARP